MTARTSDVPSFGEALKRLDVAVIAEIKRRSPSKGSINAGMRADSQAAAYREGGATAISVLTEPTRFGGTLLDIPIARRAASLPILRKDFIVAGSQLDAARAMGASAALLIVRALEPSHLRALHDHANAIGLEILVEIRDEHELDVALSIGATIIGVNNRNLETLEIDGTTVERILPRIPAECVAVAESGYNTREKVERAAAAGADAVLIGSSLSAALDPSTAVRNLTGVSKASRN